MIETEILEEGLMLVILPEWVVWVIVIWAFFGMADFIFKMILKFLQMRLNKEMKKYAEDEVKKAVNKMDLRK